MPTSERTKKKKKKKGRRKRNRTRIERALVGPCGEHYALFHLHKQGMLSSLAPFNAPSVDILVLHGDETIAASIQVKTRTYGSDGGWHMKKKHEGLKRATMFYAFVDLEPEHPAIFVVPSTVVARLSARLTVRGFARREGGGKKHKDNDMRRVLPNYKYKVPSAPAGWLEAYRDKWELIRVAAK